MAGAALAGLPLPLTAVQILYVNLATDGLPALALAVDPPEPDLMHRKPRNPRAGIFTRPLLVLLLTGGVWSAVMNISLFAWLLDTGRPMEQAIAMTFRKLLIRSPARWNTRGHTTLSRSCGLSVHVEAVESRRSTGLIG
jgi:Ca2+-transporting ATPase